MTQLADSVANRETLLKRLSEDLVGPLNCDEILSAKPSDVYLTGILFPQNTGLEPEDDEKLGSEGGGGDADSDTSSDQAPPVQTARPSTAGISFAAASDSGIPLVAIEVSAAIYRVVEGNVATGIDGTKDESSIDTKVSPGVTDAKAIKPIKKAKPLAQWQRYEMRASLPQVELKVGRQHIELGQFGIPNMGLHLQVSDWNGQRLVTSVLINENKRSKEDSRITADEKTFFQVGMKIVPLIGSSLPSRVSPAKPNDDDGYSSALIYRNAREFAFGHTCSATWLESEEGQSALEIAISWIPTSCVSATSSLGDKAFSPLRQTEGLHPLSAAWLAVASKEQLIRALELVPKCYENWIDSLGPELDSLDNELKQQGELHIRRCREVKKRISHGIDVIASNENVRFCFQASNEVMLKQRLWQYPSESDLVWRPFQLGFFLMTLPSAARIDVDDREVLDLLWFPTGGGKTEAYLALVAFVMMYRRFMHEHNPDIGAGVTTIMRYTLRLLTTQQFERAAAMVCAAEYLRRTAHSPIAEKLGQVPFSLGCWVGQDAVPNDVESATSALADNAGNSPALVENCPCCKTRLVWARHFTPDSIRATCPNSQCNLANVTGSLPIWTVDEDVYRERPSLLIGTIDKFAQIVRKRETGVLFGLDGLNDAPDLIIQDELHLISGPLGTLTGLYEVIIDALCRNGAVPPKLIGSTATIRRAEDQITALFNRKTRQFPPPGLSADNSGFAMKASGDAGRLYVGLTTAGRSAKFTLQAVTASLLQSAASLAPGEEGDGYWTLVSYFNSLRELGGALVLMQDDVSASIKDYATRRTEAVRVVTTLDEMTSRVNQLRIKELLQELKVRRGEPGCFDALLASNMISVGVDIQRLGLMVVNGQPKGMSEYIQATSRVGRGEAPGLVVAIYNHGKARDRSHFESFVNWHRTLYRDVEATSVTPFAPRARDRALHAVLVGATRHLAAGMTSPTLSQSASPFLDTFINAVVARAAVADPDEAIACGEELRNLRDQWELRGTLKHYWNDFAPKSSLLVSAERAAAQRATGRMPGAAWPTQNSMRSVEASTPFSLAEWLRPDNKPDK